MSTPSDDTGDVDGPKTWKEARASITGDTWLDDLARQSLDAAEQKWSDIEDTGDVAALQAEIKEVTGRLRDAQNGHQREIEMHREARAEADKLRVALAKKIADLRAEVRHDRTEWASGVLYAADAMESAALILAADPVSLADVRCTCDPGPEGQHQLDRCAKAVDPHD